MPSLRIRTALTLAGITGAGLLAAPPASAAPCERHFISAPKFASSTCTGDDVTHWALAVTDGRVSLAVTCDNGYSFARTYTAQTADQASMGTPCSATATITALTVGASAFIVLLDAAGGTRELAGVNAGYAGTVVATSGTDTSRQVTGMCSFRVIPVPTQNQALLVADGFAKATGTRGVTSTFVVCEINDDHPRTRQFYAESDQAAAPAVAVNGSYTVHDAFFEVCVTSEAVFADGSRAVQERTCRRPQV